MGYKCLDCGKVLSNEKGLAGHIYGVHGRRTGRRPDIKAAKDMAELSCIMADEHPKRLSHFLDEYDTRLSRLEELLKGYEDYDGVRLPPSGYNVLAKERVKIKLSHPD